MVSPGWAGGVPSCLYRMTTGVMSARKMSWLPREDRGAVGGSRTLFLQARQLELQAPASPRAGRATEGRACERWPKQACEEAKVSARTRWGRDLFEEAADATGLK